MKNFKLPTIAACALALCAASANAATNAATNAKSAKNASQAAQEDIRIVKINDANLDKEILSYKKPILLEVSSTSCPPCLTMIPTIISIAKNHREIKVASIGYDDPGMDKVKATFPIQAFPTFFIMKDGKIVDQIVGATKEEILLAAFGDAVKPAAKAPAPKADPTPRKLTCTVNGQFSGLKNFVNISFVFTNNEITDFDLTTDVFVPPELDREALFQRFSSSGKGEVTRTMTGLRVHNNMESRFIKALDMKKTSTYGEMKAGLELQGFSCK